MKNKAIWCSYTALALLAIAQPSTAAIAVTDDLGQLLGFDDIAIGTEVYDVRFKDGSFNQIFGVDGSRLDFDDNGARDASIALMNAYNEYPVHDRNPTTTYGIGFGTGNYYIYTPGSLVNVSGDLYYFGYRQKNTPDFSIYDQDKVEPLSWGDPTSISISTDSYVFADWKNAAVVPVPAAAWLFGGALLGLIGFSRGKRA